MDIKLGPLRESKLSALLKECIDKSDDSNFTQSFMDTEHLYYTVPWMNRVVVLDRRTKSVEYDANGWGFKSISSAAGFVQSLNVNIFSSLDPGEDESSRTGVDFCDLC